MKVYEFVGKYYDLRPPRQSKWAIGDLAEAPVLYTDREQTVVRIAYVDPRHEENPLITLDKAAPKDFDHPPVTELELRDDEALFAIKGKYRPVVVFSDLDAADAHGGATLLCLPVYSLDERFPAAFVTELEALKYRHSLYLPADSSGTLHQSFIRFRGAQSIPVQWLREPPSRRRLSESALTLVKEWFVYYVTGEAGQFIRDLQATLAEAGAASGP